MGPPGAAIDPHGRVYLGNGTPVDPANRRLGNGIVEVQPTQRRRCSSSTRGAHANWLFRRDLDVK